MGGKHNPCELDTEVVVLGVWPSCSGLSIYKPTQMGWLPRCSAAFSWMPLALLALTSAG